MGVAVTPMLSGAAVQGMAATCALAVVDVAELPALLLCEMQLVGQAWA